mmetsp:Transcript_32192/g.90147  ORF Transcript_32192/g.90147 Transcript_32192/m.90147 type:complete len:294 (+) Transcript_32192:401-1282(+)
MSVNLTELRFCPGPCATPSSHTRVPDGMPPGLADSALSAVAAPSASPTPNPDFNFSTLHFDSSIFPTLALFVGPLGRRPTGRIAADVGKPWLIAKDELPSGREDPRGVMERPVPTPDALLPWPARGLPEIRLLDIPRDPLLELIARRASTASAALSSRDCSAPGRDPKGRFDTPSRPSELSAVGFPPTSGGEASSPPSPVLVTVLAQSSPTLPLPGAPASASPSISDDVSASASDTVSEYQSDAVVLSASPPSETLASAVPSSTSLVPKSTSPWFWGSNKTEEEVAWESSPAA